MHFLSLTNLLHQGILSINNLHSLSALRAYVLVTSVIGCVNLSMRRVLDDELSFAVRISLFVEVGGKSYFLRHVLRMVTLNSLFISMIRCI